MMKARSWLVGMFVMMAMSSLAVTATHAAKPSEPPGQANRSFTLFGNATVSKSGTAPQKLAIELLSLDYEETADYYAGISFDIADDLQLGDLTNLSATYQVLEGSLGGGSPRFVIGVDEDADGEADCYLNVYLGTYPNYDDEPAGVVDSGNLLSGYIDASQCGGAFYDTYDNVLDTLGEDTAIVSIELVADGGWATEDGVQLVVIEEAKINNTKYRPTGKDKAK